MKTDIYKIKTDQAWNRLYNRLDNDRLLAKVDEGHHTRKYSQWIRYGAVAAVLIGVIWGTLYWVTGSDKELAQHLLTQENQGVSTLATTLEDGSVVLLAKETSLLYPKHFIADKRNGAFSSLCTLKAVPSTSILACYVSIQKGCPCFFAT